MPNSHAKPAHPVARPRAVLELVDRAQPMKMQDFVAAGGGAALGKALTLGHDALLELIVESKLVCRDGRGPLADAMIRAQRSIISCQAHRPLAGTFDRMALERCPHALLEGMAIAAYAVRASAAHLFIAADAGSAVTRALLALDECAKLDLVGENILGSDFSLNVSVHKVSPDDTAQPGPQGFVTSPETYLCLRTLVLQRADAFKANGCAGQSGTKLVAFQHEAGVAVDEIPMGSDIVAWAREQAGQAEVRAFQVGQPLGVLVRPSDGPLLLDADLMATLGEGVDAGCVAALTDRTCMVQLALSAIETAHRGACDRCLVCRVGLEHVAAALGRLVAGAAAPGDLSRLADCAAGARDLAACPASRAALGLLLAALDQFPEDFEQHAIHARCPAATCECVTVARCEHACPLGVNVPQFVGLVSKRGLRRAVDLVRRRNPFPSVCGRLCHRPCERRCVLGDETEPLAIRDLERFVVGSDTRKRPPLLLSRDDTGKSVVIVGAGPAGLSAGYFLAAMGHRVTVYEREAKPGGALATLAPRFMLSDESLQRDLAQISRRLRLRLSSPVTTKQRLGQLLRNADAALIATGMECSAPSAIPGSKAQGVIDGLDFLRQCRAGRLSLHGHAAVIGPASLLAAYAARCAARLATRGVTWYVLDPGRLAELSCPLVQHMPAGADAVAAAEADGVELVRSVTDVEILAEAGRVAGLAWDAVGAEREVSSAHSVVLALGRLHDAPFLPHKSIEVTHDGRVAVDPATGAAGLAGVFAAGECAHGPLPAVEAMAAGVRAAMAMDRHLGGDGSLPLNLDATILDDQIHGRSLPTEHAARAVPKAAKPKDAFAEYVATLAPEAARAESMRCRRCRIARVCDR